MAHRVTYLKLLRRIHFYASIILFTGVLFYLFTGYIMAHHQWFNNEKPIIESISLSADNQFDTLLPDQSFNRIAEMHEISGRNFKAEKQSENKWIKSWERPGVRNELTYYGDTDSLTIKTIKQQTFTRITNRLHHITGFKGSWIYVLWGIFVDLVILGLLVFSITGILIWIKLRKKFVWGWPILIFSTGVVFSVFVWLYFF